MTSFSLRVPAALLGIVLLAACEAGPPAFGEGGETPRVPDTADVAELGEIPHAPDVEPLDSTVEAELAPGGAGEEADSGEVTSPTYEGPTFAFPGDAIPADSLAPPTSEAPPVRGLYLNAWASGSTRRVSTLLDVARRTEVNTFVIDIKDASGYVSHATEVPLAREIGATEEIRIRDLPGLLDTLEAEGIYPIARIVIVKDPLLAAARPELAVQDTAGGPWADGKGTIWLNPFDTAVWDYHVALAKEVVAMGFPEIQWDYVRFPDAPRSELERAVFPGAEGRTKPQAIRAFLEYSRSELEPLGVKVTADVFGVTTSASRDVGIGQVWEEFIDVVDVALPMVYPSHYWEGSFGLEVPNAFPYEVVREALEDAVRRSRAVEGAGTTRPWLQDFSLGEPIYGAAEVRAQIQATYDAGIDEWILWNPGSRYTVGALEPVGGWPAEPEIRVADQVVPVSRRWDLLVPEEPVLVTPDREADAAGEPEELPEAVADPPAAAADTSTAGGPGGR